MSENEKSDGLMVGIFIALGVVVLAGLGVGSLGLVRYQKAREQERRALTASNLAQIRQAMAQSIVIVGEVESLEPLSSETPVHACPASVANPLWIVRCKVLERPHGSYDSEECNILVHSPSADLGIQTPGQKVRLELRIAMRPLQITAGSEDELTKIRYANPAGPLELVSHEIIE